MKLCTRYGRHRRRTPSQRWCKFCHAEHEAERKREARAKLEALVVALLALVPRETHPRVERRYNPERARKISATKLARNAERRQAGAR